MNRVKPGAVALGALSGLAGAMLLFLILGITGAVTSPSDTVPLFFLQFLGLVGSGYVAGRLGGRDQVLHGGYAGLVLFAIASAFALAGAPDSANLLVIVFTGTLAIVLGSAGGALSKALER